MSKKETTNGNGHATEATLETKPEVSKKDKVALFKAYEDADMTVLQLEAKLTEAQSWRSASVQAIQEKCGNGPFGYKGKELVIMKRGETYFFRGRGDRTVDIIA